MDTPKLHDSCYRTASNLPGDFSARSFEMIFAATRDGIPAGLLKSRTGPSRYSL